MRGQPQRGLRRFIATTASVRSFLGPFGPGRRLRSGENNKRYFRFLSTLEMEHSRRLKNDGGTENALPAHEKRAQAGDDTIRGTQVGGTLSTTIEDQQLMLHRRGFGDDGTNSA